MLLSLLLPPRGLSDPQGCIEGHITISQASIRMPRHTTQPAEDPWTEWSAKECIEGHNTITADFDTHATAYYSACFTSPWTEWSEGVYRRPHYHIADFDTYATAYYSACSIPRGLSDPQRRSVSKATSPYRRLRYVCHGILLSLLVSNGQ